MVDSPSRSPSRLRRWGLHAYRVGLFVFLIVMIHRQHDWFVEQKRGAMKQPVGVEQVLAFYPNATRLSEWDPNHGGQNVFDDEDETLGYVLQTSPEADDVIGFSGPTNTLIAFDKDRKILGLLVLNSDDTKEHLSVVLKSETFLRQWNGLRKDEAAANPDMDAVSGATLTSNSITDGIATRLGGGARTSRFPEELQLEEVTPVFPAATILESVENRPGLFRILDSERAPLGFAARTSPHADHMIGYQGPSDLLLLLDPEERLTHLSLRDTFDNEPYVKLMLEDEYFFNTFVGFDLNQLSQIDMVDAGIDGVTGATKTSITAAEGLVEAATELIRIREPAPPKPWIDLSAREIGTLLVILAALLISFTRLRGNRKLRIAFQVVLVFYLGFINGDMISQAQLAGWGQNGIPWKVAPALVLLTAAAILAPIFTGRQIYCTHLCPYGAAQDRLARRLPKQFSLHGKLDKVLSSLPVLLLLWVLIVAMGHLSFSLVGIEPFDAFVFRIAGWMTITVAIIGLIASLFVPRAYCRYGCPTGAMLKWLRISAASERFGRRDWVAACFVLIAIGMTFLR